MIRRSHPHPLIALRPHKSGNCTRTKEVRHSFLLLPAQTANIGGQSYPLLTKFSLDTILSSKTLHVVKCVDGYAFNLQKPTYRTLSTP